ncbi:MAG: hypothetical protein ACJ77K_10315 [Bacteroidia bacterium]
MKNRISIILLLVPFLIPAQGVLKLEKDTIDIGLVVIPLDSTGKIATSTYRDVEFKFQNTGNEPLIISSCNGGGKGFANLPSTPLLPGKADQFKVTIYQFKYLTPIDKDGLHAFCTELILTGNFVGEKRKIYVKGYTKLFRKG